MTRKQAIRMHRELWDWLFHHPSKGKKDWPRWELNGGDIEAAAADCFLCEYMRENRKVCDRCPLLWPGGGMCVVVFERWRTARSPATRKKHAKTMRDLPERKG